jgi:hypothetical protein
MFPQRWPAFVSTSACLCACRPVPRSTLADVNERGPSPLAFVIAGGVVAALALVFGLGMVFGISSDQLGGGDWHWGNILTVTVASLALIASVAVGAVTLDRNSKQFEQSRHDNLADVERSRLDARNDKLRAEVAALVNTLAERVSRISTYEARMYETLDDLGGNAKINAGEAAYTRLAQALKALVAEHISPVYERTTGHVFAILLQTDSPSMLLPLMRIGDALKSERLRYAKTLGLIEKLGKRKLTPADFAEAAENEQDNQDALEKEISSATAELILETIKSLSPAGVAVSSLDIDTMLRLMREDKPQ